LGLEFTLEKLSEVHFFKKEKEKNEKLNIKRLFYKNSIIPIP
jgi:hypothetical protein